jgi:hypothetical protein
MYIYDSEKITRQMNWLDLLELYQNLEVNIL